MRTHAGTNTALKSDPNNPLCCVEDTLEDRNWDFTRTAEDELVVEVAGRACAYRLFFIWDSEMQAIHFCVRYDLNIHPGNVSEAARRANEMNESLWLGHFCIAGASAKPTFRYTHMIGGQDRDLYWQLESIIETSLRQCEQNYPVFALLAHADGMDDETLPLAFMTPLGQS